MVCGRRTLVVTAMLFAGLGYWLYSPMPDDIEGPWNVRAMQAFIKASDALARTLEAVGYDSYVNNTRAAFRILLKTPATGSHQNLEVINTNFDGVPVRIYKPKGPKAKVLPGVVFYHGGGWVLLGVDDYDSVARTLAQDTGAVVVSVDYRLAPEHPFPIPFDDCFTATLHFMKNADKYGVDPSRIAVAGDSAGGNLAAAVSHKMSADPSLPKPRVQVLIYPLLQLCDLNTPSIQYMRKFRQTGVTLQHMMLYYLNASMKYFPVVTTNEHLPIDYRKICNELYNINLIPKEFIPEDYQSVKETFASGPRLPKDIIKLIFNPLVSPLLARDMRNLPSTLVINSGFDGLLNDGLVYSKRLELAEVKVKWRNFPSCFHGSFNFYDDKSKRCSQMFSSVVDYLKETLI